VTSFSLAVEGTCLAVLVSLLLYTLGLTRSGRLSAHVTVRWVLAEAAAIAAVLLWGRLPMIAYTSRLEDRELLVILAVLFFGLIAFLMLDSLVRISVQSVQIKRLTQELALLRASLQAGPTSDPRASVELQPTRPTGGELKKALLTIWVVACIGIYLLQVVGLMPDPITRMLTATYGQ
jgi:hypothetical protein